MADVAEKIVLLVVIAALALVILEALRAIVESGDRPIPSFYRLLTVVMLALLAIAAYALLKRILPR